MRKLSDYNGKTINECFYYMDMKKYDGKDISQVNIQLQDKTDNVLNSITLEKGKFLSYFGTRFAKIDNKGVIHIFKDFMGN